MDWAVTRAADAYRNRAAPASAQASASRNPDLLTRLLKVQETHADVVDHDMMVTYLLNNLVAGSDTIANLLGATVYHVLKNSSVHGKLRRECRPLTIPVKGETALRLPYLTAVLRESMRIYPGISLMLERVVPAGGLLLSDGRFVPHGTVVGMNPWVVSRDENVFGPEPERFLPERWLRYDTETDEEFQQRSAQMNGADLGFGFGKRACLGKSLSYLVSHKAIAALFAMFDIELVDPDAEWKVTNSWFMRNENMPVFLQKRSVLSAQPEASCQRESS